MYFLDTNIFLEYILEGEYFAECGKILQAVEKKEINAVCSYFSINSICVFGAGHGKQKEIQKLLEYIASLENLFIANTTVPDNQKILGITLEAGLDFDDALQYYIAKQAQCKAIITLDQDFKKTKINSLHPKEFKI